MDVLHLLGELTEAEDYMSGIKKTLAAMGKSNYCIEYTEKGNTKIYANREHPLFEQLKSEIKEIEMIREIGGE